MPRRARCGLDETVSDIDQLVVGLLASPLVVDQCLPVGIEDRGEQDRSASDIVGVAALGEEGQLIEVAADERVGSTSLEAAAGRFDLADRCSLLIGHRCDVALELIERALQVDDSQLGLVIGGLEVDGFGLGHRQLATQHLGCLLGVDAGRRKPRWHGDRRDGNGLRR